jgi:F-type H+-transporting ATPase subunit delta
MRLVSLLFAAAPDINDFNHNPEASLPQPAERPLVSGDAAALARRYAGALYELAEEGKQLDAVAADLRSVLPVSDANADFRAIVRHPRLTRAQLVKVAEALSAALKLGKLTSNFLALAAKHRRLPILSAMIDAFLARLAEQRGEFTASVRAATALTPQQTEQLAARLAILAGGKVHLDLREDKSLIGGLTVRLGSRLIDASVKSKLQRLERKLKSAAA